MVSSIMLNLLSHGCRLDGKVCPALRSPGEETPGLRTVLLMTQLMTEELAWSTHMWVSGSAPKIHGLPPGTLLECFSFSSALN